MNAYLVDAGEVEVTQEVIDYWERKEPVRLIDLVFAPSRGAAKATFHRQHREHIDFTDIKHVRLVMLNAKRERGIAKYDDELWDQTPDISGETIK